MGDSGTAVNAEELQNWFQDIRHEAPPEGFDRRQSRLFTPLQIGDFTLEHRVVHSAMTRTRAPNHIVSPLVVEYYAQRATRGGLIITEANFVEPTNWAFFPGLYTSEQALAWAPVVDVVHQKGGIFFAQLWHVGRTSSPSLNGGAPTVSASAVEEVGINTHSNEPFGVPRALELSEIQEMIQKFAASAKLAKDAGFDGIEVLAGNGFLLDQFLQDGVNKRTDIYGGSHENRARLTLEVIDAVADVFGSHGKVGVRISPLSFFHDMSSSDPIGQFNTLISGLSARRVAFVNVSEPHIDRATSLPTKIQVLVERGMTPTDVSLRPYLKHIQSIPGSELKLFSNGGHTLHSGLNYVEDGLADAAVYGRIFTSNPDLVERIREGNPLRPFEKATFYTHSKDGYTTYPTFNEAQAKGDLESGENTGNHVETSSASNNNNITDASTTSSAVKRIAIVGAGVAGLGSATAFERTGGFEVKIYERSSQPGGVWKTDEPQYVDFKSSLRRTELDPVSSVPETLPTTRARSNLKRFSSSPLYPSVITNIPGVVMEGHDEKLPEPEAAISPYLRQAQVVDHVTAKAAKHTSKIVLNTSVERVRKSTSGKWQVVLREEVGEDQEKWYSEEFDGVVVATGHNSVPRIPPIPGLRNWQGKLLHSISYRDAQSFANQTILIVGARESAIDIALESLPVAKAVYVSQRRPHPRLPNVFTRPGIKVVPTINRFEETRIVLGDGTKLDGVDTVIFATGFHYSYPFLEELRGPHHTDGYKVHGLYQHTFDIENPGLAFVGTIIEALSWKAWETQALLVALAWSSKIELPSVEEQWLWEDQRSAIRSPADFHLVKTPSERLFVFQDQKVLASEYLRKGGEDKWLRGWDLEWDAVLRRGLAFKSAYYSRAIPVRAKGV